MKDAEVIQGDCLVVLADLADNSVDSIVTDPPYGLSNEPDIAEVLTKWLAGEDYQHRGGGFMGKSWDSFVPGPSVWREALRVLKPGGHMLAFFGSRTYDLGVLAIRLAGFEIRDRILTLNGEEHYPVWVYGSGFSKSWNLRRAGVCDCVISGNAVPYNHHATGDGNGEQAAQHDVRLLPATDLSQAEPAEAQPNESVQSFVQQQIEGTPVSVHAGSVRQARGEDDRGSEPGMGRGSLHRAGEGISNDQDAGPSESASKRVRSGAHIGGGKDAGEAADQRRRSSPHQPRQIGQSPGKSEDLRDPLGALDGRALHGRGQCPRCGKLRKELEGFGTSLKPAHEPICVARKPLVGTVAANVLAWGTGALNTDGCRIGREPDDVSGWSKTGSRASENRAMSGANYARDAKPDAAGRWPANVIHDGSPDVVRGFPVTTSGKAAKGGHKRKASLKYESTINYADRSEIAGQLYGDTGSAARFFKQCEMGDEDWHHQQRLGQLARSAVGNGPEAVTRFVYCPKASKKDRDEGLDGFDVQRCGGMTATANGSMLTGSGNERTTARANIHPTVKPTDLMRYLCRLVTPPGGLVLDPFCGSGSTGKAAVLEGFRFLGIELMPEYAEIARARIDAARHRRGVLL